MFQVLAFISALTPLLIFLDYNKKDNVMRAVIFVVIFYAIWATLMILILNISVLTVGIMLAAIALVLFFVLKGKKK